MLPACSTSQSVSPADFSRMHWELVPFSGPPSGTGRAPALQKGVVKASTPIQAIGIYGDAHSLYPSPLLHWMGQNLLLLQDRPFHALVRSPGPGLLRHQGSPRSSSSFATRRRPLRPRLLGHLTGITGLPRPLSPPASGMPLDEHDFPSSSYGHVSQRALTSRRRLSPPPKRRCPP